MANQNKTDDMSNIMLKSGKIPYYRPARLDELKMDLRLLKKAHIYFWKKSLVTFPEVTP